MFRNALKRENILRPTEYPILHIVLTRQREYWPPRSPGVKSVLDSEIKDHLKEEAWNGIIVFFSRLP